MPRILILYEHLKMTRIQQRLQNVGQASIAQSGERQSEDLKVPGSIPGRCKAFINYFHNATIHTHNSDWLKLSLLAGQIKASLGYSFQVNKVLCV